MGICAVTARRVARAAVMPAIAAVVALWPGSAQAQTVGGNLAADYAVTQAARHISIDGGTWSDITLIARSWGQGGVAATVFHDALAGVTEQGRAAVAVSSALCTGGATGYHITPADEPQRGDVVRYTPLDNSGYRLGIFTDEAHVVVIDTWDVAPAYGHLPARVERDSVLLGRWNSHGAKPVSLDAEAVVCHVKPALIIGPGAAQAPAAAGNVQLVDGSLAVENAVWAAGHPVMTGGLGEKLRTAAGVALSIIVGAGTWLLGQAGDLLGAVIPAVDGAVRWLGWWSLLVPPLLLVAGGVHLLDQGRRLLAMSFDGRPVRRVLTAALMGLALIVGGPLLLLPLLAVGLLGGLTGRWSLTAPITTLLPLVWNIAGYAVTIVTGLNDGRTSVIEVLLATATDAFIVARPAMLVRAIQTVGTRVAGPAAGLAWGVRARRVLLSSPWLRGLGTGHRGTLLAQETGGLAADLISGHPSTLVELRTRLAGLGERGQELVSRVAGGGGTGAGLPPGLMTVAPVTSGAEAARVGTAGLLDVASWFSYRPSQCVADVVHSLGRASTVLEAGLRNVKPTSHLVYRVADRALGHLTPQERHHLLTVTLPRAAVPARLANRHSGAQVIGSLLAGEPPPSGVHLALPLPPGVPAAPWQPVGPGAASPRANAPAAPG